MNSLTSSAAAVDSRQSSYNQKNAIAAAAASPLHNAWENWVYFFPLSKHGGVSVKVKLACKYVPTGRLWKFKVVVSKLGITLH